MRLETTPRQLLKSVGKQISQAEAEFLLTALLRLPRHELYLTERPVPTRILRRFQQLVARARKGEPVQFLVHSAPFLDLDLYVDRRCLIPRPETEELVLRAADRLKNPSLIIDYGTGSGCIAIALARIFPQTRLFAVDASRPALAVCRRNVRRYRLSSRIRLLHSQDLSHPALCRLKGRVDLIISNPPYIPSKRIGRLEPGVRKHEPRLALDGGPKGARIVKMLLEQAPLFLRPGGLLALEIDHTQGRLVRALVPDVVIERDLAGRIRYAFLKRGAQR
ncbi:MAG: peptide chain release factor N(5)-glutamine methyltransferase [candidate division WOR-3 bacterium]